MQAQEHKAHRRKFPVDPLSASELSEAVMILSHHHTEVFDTNVVQKFWHVPSVTENGIISTRRAPCDSRPVYSNRSRTMLLVCFI